MYRSKLTNQDQCLLILDNIRQKALLLVLARGVNYEKAQQLSSKDGQQAFGLYTFAFKHVGDLSRVAVKKSYIEETVAPGNRRTLDSVTNYEDNYGFY